MENEYDNVDCACRPISGFWDFATKYPLWLRHGPRRVYSSHGPTVTILPQTMTTPLHCDYWYLLTAMCKILMAYDIKTPKQVSVSNLTKTPSTLRSSCSTDSPACLLTWTLNVHDRFRPALSVAVYVTGVVVSTVNSLPLAGWDVTSFTPTLSVTCTQCHLHNTLYAKCCAAALTYQDLTITPLHVQRSLAINFSAVYMYGYCIFVGKPSGPLVAVTKGLHTSLCNMTDHEN